MDGKTIIVGGGSWGTTIAKVCADAGLDTCLYVRGEDLVEEVNTKHTNSNYLPDIVFPDNLRAYHLYSDDPSTKEPLKNASIIFIGVPAQSLRMCMSALGDLPPGVPVVSLAKGLERATSMRMTEVISECLPDARVGVLSGPNLAVEVAKGMPASAVLALPPADKNIPDVEKREQFLDHFKEATGKVGFYIQRNGDVIGVEIASAMKNITAFACGLAIGLGYGNNTVACIMTAGLQEMARLIIAVGGNEFTVLSAAGISDLAATCFSDSSRNRSFGKEIAAKNLAEKKNNSNPDAQQANMVGEASNKNASGKDEPSAQSNWTVVKNGTVQVVEAIPTLMALVHLTSEKDMYSPVIDTLNKAINFEIDLRTCVDHLVELSAT